MKNAWTWFKQLPAEKRVVIAVFLVSGIAGGILLDVAIANPDHAETVFVVLGALWLAMTVLAGLLEWLAGRRRTENHGR